MNFKEWLLTEVQSCVFRRPERIAVNINGQSVWLTVDGIDFRFEDYKLEPGGTPPPQGNFSAPCQYMRDDEDEADRGMHVSEAIGSPQPVQVNGFINFTKSFMSGIGSLEPQAAYQEVRPDWARFAEFTHGNQVVKEGQYKAQRSQRDYGLARGA